MQGEETLRLYKHITGSNPVIPWDDIVETSLDEICTSQDGLERFIEYKRADASLLTSDEVETIRLQNPSNWVNPIPEE